MKEKRTKDAGLDQLPAPKRDTAKERRAIEGGQTGKVDARSLRKRDRSEQIIFRVTPEQRKQIEEAVAAEGLTITDMMWRAFEHYDRDVLRPNRHAPESPGDEEEPG
jgi:hypothetical protein